MPFFNSLLGATPLHHQPEQASPMSYSFKAVVRRPTRVAIAYCLVGLAGCATLPNAARELHAPHSEHIDFSDAHGSVTAAKSTAVLASLKDDHDSAAALQQHLVNEQAINVSSPLVLGNKVVLLQDGPATYQAMFTAIRAATDHINVESYIIDDDEIGKQFSALLLAKQAAGIQVNLIYDSVGCLNTPKSFFDHLTTAGIQVLAFNPINPLNKHYRLWRLNNRDHRKLVVVDGRIAFVGGINISKDYSSNPLSRHKRKNPSKTAGWRDIDVQIEGPVVAEFQKLFLDTWAKQTGPALKQLNYFPSLNPQGEEIVRAIGSAPDHAQSPIYLTLMSALSHAQHEVHLTIAYFAPDSQLLKAITDAARRGVDVKLVVPSYSDSIIMFNLGRSYYSKLFAAGVKIYQRRGAVMHSKTACIDGVWSTVGSTNLDWRSFLHNDEINAVILGNHFAAQMDAMFVEDLSESDVIDEARWRHRSVWSHLKERLARLGAYWF